MVAGDTLRRAVQMQSVRAGCQGGILVVADADDDCPIELADRLRELAGQQMSKLTVAVAVREFESWFLASIRSLAGHGAVRPDADYPKDPDIRRDAKGALSSLMATTYRATLHQPAFAELMDLGAAMRSRSFSHLVSSVGYLLGARGTGAASRQADRGAWHRRPWRGMCGCRVHRLVSGGALSRRWINGWSTVVFALLPVSGSTGVAGRRSGRARRRRGGRVEAGSAQ